MVVMWQHMAKWCANVARTRLQSWMVRWLPRGCDGADTEADIVAADEARRGKTRRGHLGRRQDEARQMYTKQLFIEVLAYVPSQRW